MKYREYTLFLVKLGWIKLQLAITNHFSVNYVYITLLFASGDWWFSLKVLSLSNQFQVYVAFYNVIGFLHFQLWLFWHILPFEEEEEEEKAIITSRYVVIGV